MKTLLVFSISDGIIFYREGKQVDHAQSIFLLVCTGHPRKNGCPALFCDDL